MTEIETKKKEKKVTIASSNDADSSATNNADSAVASLEKQMQDEASAARAMGMMSLFALFSICLGAGAYILNVEQNKCEMTYMFEYPQYVPVKMPKPKDPSHQRYGLYVYGEGVYERQLQSELQSGKLTGVPVLFVPGSGGSKAQARSLASVLYRKGQNLKSDVQFNVFTIDFGADFSALDGALALKQRDYVVKCLERITELYPQRTSDGKGSEIIVYGHSMGGVVAVMAAKAVANSHKIAPLVLSYAAPFRPVGYIDPILHYDIYDGLLEDFPKQNFLVAIGGGVRDHLVASPLTWANMSADQGFSVNVSQYSPALWSSQNNQLFFHLDYGCTFGMGFHRPSLHCLVSPNCPGFSSNFV